MRARRGLLRLIADLSIGVAALASFGGCALQRYEAAPLDPATSASTFESRSIDAPGLKEYMVVHGHSAPEWPVQRWGLTDLTLLAFYYQPNLELARAQAAVARAQVAAATQRPPLAIKPVAQHHSLQPPDTTGPWTLGFEVEIPLSGSGRRAALSEQYGALAQSAELAVGSAAWTVRSQVRAHLLDCYAADRTLELVGVEMRERRSLVGLLQRRFDAGAASALELSSARLKQAEVDSQIQDARLAREQCLGGLAGALGLPLAAVRNMSLDFAVFQQTPAPPNDSAVQRSALLNRLDVRAKLLDYAAADAAVKLEIARQYPSVTLSPGYIWDQGDNIWSLVATVLVPAAGNKPAIQAALARRAAAANEFLAMQGKVISDADAAQARYVRTMENAGTVQQVLDLQSARGKEARKQFDAGHADRVELTLATLETLAVEHRALAARLETQRARGALEDALQMPLEGAPLPSWASEKSPAQTVAPGLARQ